LQSKIPDFSSYFTMMLYGGFIDWALVGDPTKYLYVTHNFGIHILIFL